ncbi:NAD(P)/FAD-dependent oxidoreductase [Streptomyces verrucosisporus]|uniref:NAD(P)/FAD-dependent oxidoreductase n=1 Tax=Streptomyces verrucosisporus TaxID=1695161 RepID=UPI0019D10F64|nr:FAD-dependent oxidoreductase [Streptomyces verrucosisporus]MBN3932495.1 NAD(P)/FAD-dependent oxidoreductase [Streptomyces verrucosisporus]
MTSKKRVVVIGGGMAAARLAGQLSAAGALGPDGAAVDLTVVGEEPHAPYNRVLLAGVLAGRYAPEVIGLPAPPAARWLRGVRAVRLDRAERLVRCDDGSSLAYDALVLATGSNPVLPPLRGLFPGGGHEPPRGVRPFRTLADCRALEAEVRPGARAVVVGGGLLGVSAARALAGRGVRTVLAHQGEHLMERHLDARASALLRGHLEGLGVEVHTECRVRGLLTAGSAGRGSADAGAVARGVELADGYRLEAELVVLACGVRPRTGLARAAGLEVREGIVVDDELRTGDPRVHAVGDCAEHAGTVYGLAGAAQEQADALARVLLADSAVDSAVDGGPDSTAEGTAAGARSPAYTGTRALTRLTLAPTPSGPGGALDLAAFGETVPRAGDDVVRLADATRSVYRKVVVRGDRLVGGILLGDLGTVGALARAWEGGEPLPSAPLLHLLTNDGGL